MAAAVNAGLPMSVEDVTKRVTHIKQVSWDDEVAHGAEDDLRRDVLRSIAEGLATDPAKLAAEVLKTEKIRFARWTA